MAIYPTLGLRQKKVSSMPLSTLSQSIEDLVSAPQRVTSPEFTRSYTKKGQNSYLMTSAWSSYHLHGGETEGGGVSRETLVSPLFNMACDIRQPLETQRLVVGGGRQWYRRSARSDVEKKKKKKRQRELAKVLSPTPITRSYTPWGPCFNAALGGGDINSPVSDPRTEKLIPRHFSVLNGDSIESWVN